jgi:AraC family transcriptional regulator
LVRLKQAELLLKTPLPVADIAFSSGFNNIDYFSAAFKKTYRLSPTAYRSGFAIKQDF